MDNSSVRHGVSAIVEYDYTAKEPDELNLTKGASIHNIKVQPGGWWEGTLTSTGQTGMFPDNFVKVVEADAKNPVVMREKSATLSRRCKAVYSYTQNNNDELTLGVGDLIEFLGEVEEGWWRGQLNDKIGVFPSNFVVMEAQQPALAADRRSAAATAAAAAVTTSLKLAQQHTAAHAAIMAAEAVAVAKQMSSSREDLVSSSTPDVSVDAPVLPPKPVRELCKVIYPYTPANDDELELREGEIITILSRELPDKGWLKGELRGKTGVFPDNFVVLMSSEASPTKDTIANNKPERPPSATKTLINPKMSTSISSYSSSTSSTLNSTTKDSFGSRDSLNDTTAVIPTGNVAAYRKSLETKNLDVTSGPAATGGSATVSAVPIDKPARKPFDSKPTEFRKSIENLDEKSKGTTPPILHKKPVVSAIKKSPTVGSVAGGILSGFKSKLGSSSNKSSTSTTSIESTMTASSDNLDGIGSSRVAYSVSDNHVISERIRRDNSADFDQVERGQSILQDMRAGRAKAPKRRPPTNAVSITGSSTESTGDASYSNGSATEGTNGDATDPDQETKTKASGARNWETKKAPWIDELRKNQAQKTSPPVGEFGGKSLDYEPSVGNTNVLEKTSNASFDMSKSFSSSYVSSTSSSSATSSHSVRKTSEFNNFSTAAELKTPVSVVGDVKLRSSTENHMARSMSGMSSNRMTFTAGNSEQATTLSTSAEKKPRPTSVNLRNRSISPIGRMSMQPGHIASPPQSTATVNNSANQTTTTAIDPTAKALHVNNLIIADLPPSGSTSSSNHVSTTPVTIENVCPRVQELELKVSRLERLVQQQAQTIDDLLRSSRDESDKVKTLRGELDKYAQCVTQV